MPFCVWKGASCSGRGDAREAVDSLVGFFRWRLCGGQLSGRDGGIMGMIAMVQDVLSDLCFEDVAAVAWIFFPVSKYDGTSNGLLKMARVCVC